MSTIVSFIDKFCLLKKKKPKSGNFLEPKIQLNFSFFGENFANFFYVTKLIF
jgi:hypothetical protein